MTSRPLRITMLNHNYAQIGTFFRCLRIARELARRGHEVTLLTKDEHSRLRTRRRRVDGVDVVATPKGLMGRVHLGELGLLDIGYRPWHLFRQKPDVVWSFSVAPDVVLPARAARRLAPGSLLLADRDDVVTGGLLESWRGRRIGVLVPRAERWDRELPARADGVTVASRWLERETLELGVPAERLLFLPNGADVESAPALSKREARERMGLPPDGSVVALMATGAGHDQTSLLPLIRPVLDAVPDTVWVFIGHPEPQRAAFVREHGLGDRVRETGFVPAGELAHWLTTADVVLLPNADIRANFGRWPMRLGDAMAAGRPVVTAAVGEAASVVEHEGMGVLAARDGRDLPERIVELLRDPSRAEELGRKARLAADERYDWRLLIDRLEEFLEARRADVAPVRSAP